MRDPITGDLITPPPRMRREAAGTDFSTWKLPLKLTGDAGELRARAVSSLTLAIELFNRPVDTARAESVFLLLHHAFEMLLKAILRAATGTVHDQGGKFSYSFDKCLQLLREANFLDESEKTSLSILDAHRDTSAHYFQAVSEDLLYLQAQTAVTLFGTLLERAYREKLADYLPSRILPISTRPPTDLQLLVGSELDQVDELLGQKRKKATQAAAKLRSVLALAAGARDVGRVSEVELKEALSRRSRGSEWAVIFPELARLTLEASGTGLTIGLSIKKKSEISVRIAQAGDPVDGTVIRREVNIWDTYNLSRDDIARKLKLSGPRTSALIMELSIQQDRECFHTLTKGGMTHKGYSKKALDKMRDALEKGLSIDVVWARHGHKLAGRKKKRQATLFDRA